MSVVNTETGEVTDLDPAAAERRAMKISLRLDNIADNYEAVMPMIREALALRDYFALGYKSASDYVSARFGKAMTRLPVEVRREVVQELTDAGLSTRAIAAPLGISEGTVRNDLNQVRRTTHLTETPAPTSDGEADEGAGQAGVVGEVAADALRASDPATPEAREAAGYAELAKDRPPSRPPVTGIDGKTYAAPAPRPPKPVLAGESADYDNAEKASVALSRAVRKLLEFQHPNMRQGMKRYWSMASVEVPPVQRADVTPEQMRVAAHGLLALADEWT